MVGGAYPTAIAFFLYIRSTAVIMTVRVALAIKVKASCATRPLLVVKKALVKLSDIIRQLFYFFNYICQWGAAQK